MSADLTTLTDEDVETRFRTAGAPRLDADATDGDDGDGDATDVTDGDDADGQDA